jgi:cell division septation protein DedD
MTLRALIVMLVLANLGFAAWALLIDRPMEIAAARDISHLPTLVLAGDAAPAAPAASSAAKAATGAPTVAGPTRPVHCVTVGPFADLAAAAAASALLQSRGFTPAQRDEPGPDLIAYSVYLDDVRSEAAATRMLQKLHSNGIADARVMPIATAAEALRVSVGLFNERKGAERRVKQVKSLGLSAAITEQHQPQATYWVNINLSSPGQSVSTEGLLPPAAADAHLEISDCPSPPSSAPAARG